MLCLRMELEAGDSVGHGRDAQKLGALPLERGLVGQTLNQMSGNVPIC